jgi:hypothetical protein
MYWSSRRSATEKRIHAGIGLESVNQWRNGNTSFGGNADYRRNVAPQSKPSSIGRTTRRSQRAIVTPVPDNHRMSPDPRRSPMRHPVEADCSLILDPNWRKCRLNDITLGSGYRPFRQIAAFSEIRSNGRSEVWQLR